MLRSSEDGAEQAVVRLSRTGSLTSVTTVPKVVSLAEAILRVFHPAKLGGCPDICGSPVAKLWMAGVTPPEVWMSQAPGGADGAAEPSSTSTSGRNSRARTHHFGSRTTLAK